MTNGIARIFVAIGALVLLPAPASAHEPITTTGAGRVQGIHQGTVAAYLGIPYAAPPVGANRWRAPQPLTAWQGVRKTTAFGASCWQAVSPEGFGPWSHEYVVDGPISEDCLFLNVWAPAKSARPAPVLVWIHGGGFNSGSGAIPIYNGEALARRGIVVVTINYRVAVFGFLAHPELTREAGAAPAANYGLQDMIAALHWVHDNIASFGGDPNAVTIAGQSAGSMAVHDLIASPLARGLFQRAVAESGLPNTRPATALADAQQGGIAFAKEKGAASLAALRAMPAETLQASRGGNSIRFVPVVDGRLLAEDPQHAVEVGHAADVPMLAGFTADEGSALAQGYGSSDPQALELLLEESFGGAAGTAASFYPSATEAERAQSNIQIRRDRGLAALYSWAASRPGTSPTYGYLFSHVQPGPDATRWRAFHSSEIPYVFQTFDAAPERGWTEDDRSLSQTVSAYWLNFIRTGDPNGAGLPAWPRLDARQPKILEIGDTPAAPPLLPAEKLRLFAGPDGRASIF